MKNIIALISILLLISCGSKKQEQNEEGEYSGGSFDVNVDGTYCADVSYSNPNTGTENTYQLNIEIENQELLRILWPNGGWLDDDHFSNVVFDNRGYASFTSDKGYDYTIQINGPECNFTDANQMERDVRNDESKVRCPECGNEKSSYDDLCDDCERKKKDKEEHTCKKCGNYDSFMFSTDDMCSDCKRKEEREKEEEEEKKRQEEGDN